MKKEKKPETVIRNMLTAAFYRYHLDKMSLGEFIIRFLRIDLLSKGRTDEKEELLRVIRNHQRGIKEDCNCPEPEKKRRKSIRDYLFKN